MLFMLICLGIVLGLFVAAIIIYFVFLIIVKKKIFSTMYDHRYDDNHTLKYFTVEYFENLKNEPISFETDGGVKLNGYLYFAKDQKEYKALLIFSHGLGAGHLQYTTEINYFAQKGFLVLAYDNTGCNLSEGKGIVCFARGAIDLKYAIDFVNTREDLKALPLVLCGHSMGAFAVSNVSSLLKDNSQVKCIVALAPFYEENELIYSYVKKITRSRILKKMIAKQLLKRTGKIKRLNTVDSINSCDTPYFLITGDKDDDLDYEENFARIKNGLNKRENFEYLIVNERYHRPNLTMHAAQYDIVVKMEKRDLKKSSEEEKEFYKNLDYNLLVEMDEKVMGQIIEFINRNI